MNQKNSLGDNSTEGRITLSEIVSHKIASKFLTKLIDANEYYKQETGLSVNDNILELLLCEIQETNEWKQLFKQFEEKYGEWFKKIQISLDAHHIQIQKEIAKVFDESIKILQKNREEYREEDQKIFQELKQGIDSDQKIRKENIILPNLIEPDGDMYEFFSEDLTINQQFDTIVDEFIGMYVSTIDPILIKKYILLMENECQHGSN